MATGLATRCSACGTVFRVVPDQLRVSEGWVRCGRCSQVFNALEGLVDLDTGLPKQTAGSPAHPEAEAPGDAEFDIAHPAARPGSPPLPPAQPTSIASGTRKPPSPRPAEPKTPAWPAAAGGSAVDIGANSVEGTLATSADLGNNSRSDNDSDRHSDSRSSIRSADHSVTHSVAHSVAHSDSPLQATPTDPAAQAPAESEAETASDKPSFVRSAERAERWRSPKVRAALAATALLAMLTLVAQASLQYRDVLAAQVPETRPWLAQACAALGCKVEAARSIESLAVDSSGLVRVEKSNLYKMQVTLRNRGGMDVAVPALDLTLTDGQGRLIARKVLRLSELGASQATIAAGRELAVLATVQVAAAGEVAQQPIAGYTIELFYP